MAKTKLKVQNRFSGGIVRDDKSKVVGALSNCEEIDIFSNADFIQAEQIMSVDAMPTGTEIYDYTTGDDGTVYGYGEESSSGKVRLVFTSSNGTLATSGGSSNPDAFATFMTASSVLAYPSAPAQYFETSESATGYIYYLTISSTTVKLNRCKISDKSESEVGTLDGLNGSYDRLFLEVIYGELYIGNGRYIAKVDEDGVFTQHAFTLPMEWEAVDLIAVADAGLILARPMNINANYSKGFWWDLTTTEQFTDSFSIPMGGPQWIVNHKETIKILCAQNGIAKIFQLSGAFQGAVPIEIPGVTLSNIATETSTQTISGPKMVATKDKILYFGLYKTDKSGIYAMGQLDNDKPNALILSKRFHTTNYANHIPYGLLIEGPNFYAAFSDGGTTTNTRCETLNSPARSSNAVLESIWIDDDSATNNKDLEEAFVTTYPLPASTDVDVYIASDYGSYTQYLRPDGTSLNTTNAVIGAFKVTQRSKKVYKIKLALTSSTVNSPKVTSFALKLTTQDSPAVR